MPSSSSFFSAVESCASNTDAARARSNFSRVEIAMVAVPDMSSSLALGWEVSTNFSRNCLCDSLRIASIHDSDPDAGITGHFCCSQLRAHASTSELAVTTAHRFHCEGQLAYGPNQLRALPIWSVEAINVGEQQQPVCIDRSGEECTQFVVVAECAFQFPHRYTVVFVCNRHHAQTQQLIERVLQVLVTRRGGEIIARKQQLGDNLFPEEELLVGVHERALSDRRTGLHEGNARRPFFQAEVRNARRDCARADNEKLVLWQIKLVH